MCKRCLETYPRIDLDRLLWCDACIDNVRARVTRQSWLVGLVIAVILALWIWLYIQPSDLVIGGWIATVVASLWVGARVAREIVYGVIRFTNRKAVEAVPPSLQK